MLTATRCAWLAFVEAHRFAAVLIPLGGFLVLILFSLLRERIGRLLRQIFQLAIVVAICAGVAAVIYETRSPRECAAPSAPGGQARDFRIRA
jgi:putative intracellular protease/amidase